MVMDISSSSEEDNEEVGVVVTDSSEDDNENEVHLVFVVLFRAVRYTIISRW